MSVFIHSPLNSEVFSYLDSLSPPPAPIAKRARRFFTSNDKTPPSPIFFPKGKSVIESPNACQPPDLLPANGEAMEKRRLDLLASRSAPGLRLAPRSANVPQVEGPGRRIQVDQFPPLPFSFPVAIPALDSEKNSPGPASVSKSAPKKPESIMYPNQQAKLPAFQRGGIKHQKAKKRSSIVARSA